MYIFVHVCSLRFVSTIATQKQWLQGFRKVDPDRWEFANEGFLGGQRYLLKNIKRRRNISQNIEQQQDTAACVELGQFGLEGEINQLTRDRNVLMVEIVKLRQQQQTSRTQLVAMEERLRGTERKQQQMMAFLARALKNPTFAQQLVQRHRQKKELTGIGRKRRLPASASLESLQQEVISEMGSDFVSYPLQDQEEVAMGTDIETLFAAGSSSSLKNQSTEMIASSDDPNVDPVNDIIWEELINEDLVAGGEGDDDGGDETEIDLEVEDLSEKPSDWGDDVLVLVEQLGFLG